MVTDGQEWNTITTSHGLLMIFFSVMPAAIGGFGNWFIPLMIGAPDMAFPRLNNISLVLLPPAFLADHHRPVSWASSAWAGRHPLLSNLTHEPQHSAWTARCSRCDLAGGQSATQRHQLHHHDLQHARMPGMTLHKMPLFVWAMLVTAFLLLLEYISGAGRR